MAPLVMPSWASNRATAASTPYTGRDRNGVAEFLDMLTLSSGTSWTPPAGPGTSARTWLTLDEERILRVKRVDVNLFYIELLKFPQNNHSLMHWFG